MSYTLCIIYLFFYPTFSTTKSQPTNNNNHTDIYIKKENPENFYGVPNKHTNSKILINWIYILTPIALVAGVFCFKH